MTLWQQYVLPQNIEQAVEARSSAGENACYIAGGTDLLLDLQQGRRMPVELLVDVTGIPELGSIEIRSDRLFVGAGVPLHRVITHDLVQAHAPVLVEAASLIGGPQVRHTATLGGNVAHALPAADGTIALLALDALADVVGPSGRRLLPLETLFLAPGKSTLSENLDLLVGFHLPLRRPNHGSAFRRVMRPQGVAIAILNLAIWLEREGECIADVRLTAGPTGSTPRRLAEAETVLRGKPNSPQLLESALAALQNEVHLRSSRHRATAAYRHHVLESLFTTCFELAWARAV
jgi:carbon-monoxide dehydrogenase medium subunit